MITYKNFIIERKEDTGGSRALYTIDGEDYCAEEVVITQYQKEGYSSLWTENVYWWTIMSLLFWDVIFAKVKGAVKVATDGDVDPSDSKFEELYNQTVKMNGIPADFFTGEFYYNRKALIQNRIKELQHGDIKEKFNRSYDNNYKGICRPAEALNNFTKDQFLLVFDKLGEKAILGIVERLITNYSENRQGLPDLIVYNNDVLFFAEVKSEKDKISEKQKDWHSYLSDEIETKVEICLLNRTEKQVQKAKEDIGVMPKKIKISFGASSSKKREDAIRFVKNWDTYFSEGEGKNQIHGCTMDLNDIENVFTLLDFTSGWKTQKIEIDSDLVKSTELRASLYCFREKGKQKASSDYCKKNEYSGGTNKFGCKQIYFHQLVDDQWDKFGFIDSESGDWIFDKNEIEGKCDEEIQRLKYCPLFDDKKIKRILKKIPDSINPQKDNSWAYISNDHEKWIYSDNQWYGGWGERKFPGISAMVGVEKLAKKEINETIKYAKMEKGDITLTVSTGTTEENTQKSGCFVATVVYGSYFSNEVLVLRWFRDNILDRNVFGKMFINVYYKIGPIISAFIGSSKFLRSIMRRILNVFVDMLRKRMDDCEKAK